jgi:hypothetical protein
VQPCKAAGRPPARRGWWREASGPWPCQRRARVASRHRTIDRLVSPSPRACPHVNLAAGRGARTLRSLCLRLSEMIRVRMWLRALEPSARACGGVLSRSLVQLGREMDGDLCPAARAGVGRHAWLYACCWIIIIWI